jgi:hypothetical protein
MDIVIIKNNFCTLADVVIANPSHINLMQHASTMIMHVATITVQDNAQSYTERMPKDDFIPLAIKMCSCLHPRFDSFLTSCLYDFIPFPHKLLVLEKVSALVGQVCDWKN